MPLSDFRWLNEEEISQLDWTNMNDDQEYGYLVECDLSYPKKLHISHNSFPLAPETLKIDSSYLSSYAKGKYV
jgi:hypothetical protein